MGRRKFTVREGKIIENFRSRPIQISIRHLLQVVKAVDKGWGAKNLIIGGKNAKRKKKEGLRKGGDWEFTGQLVLGVIKRPLLLE